MSLKVSLDMFFFFFFRYSAGHGLDSIPLYGIGGLMSLNILYSLDMI